MQHDYYFLEMGIGQFLQPVGTLKFETNIQLFFYYYYYYN